MHTHDTQKLEQNAREVVVVLHGFGASPHWMLLLSRRIGRTRRRVVNWGYPSWRRTVDWNSDRLLELYRELIDDESIDKVHFICYSMGSIVCRAALLKHPERAKLGRVVMLGPPNRGSHVATFFAPLIGKLVPGVRDLCAKPHSYVNGLPRMFGVEVGIVAAGGDRIVKLDSTHLPSQREHIVVPGGHGRLILSRGVARSALHFIETGSFPAAEELGATCVVPRVAG